MTPFYYFRTLGEAFRTAFKHYQIFLPFVILYLFGFLSLPFYKDFMPGFRVEPFSSVQIATLIVCYFLLLVCSLVSYGWVFAFLKQVINKDRLNLKESFQESFPLAWKLFKVSLLLLITICIGIMLFMMPVIFLFVLIAKVAPALNIGKGIVLVTFLISFFFIIFFIILSIFLWLISILALEEKGAWASIKMSFQYFKQNKSHSTKMALVSCLLLIIAYIPSEILWLNVGFSQINKYMIEHTISYFIFSNLASIPFTIVTIGIMMFYCLAYTEKHK